MGSHNWLEADRIERLRPPQQEFYRYCLRLTEEQRATVPWTRSRGWLIHKITLGDETSKGSVSFFVNSLGRTHSITSTSFEDLLNNLIKCNSWGVFIRFPPDLIELAAQERRLRVSEEELDYRLGSGDPY